MELSNKQAVDKFECERCGRAVAPDEEVYDVAISPTTAAEVQSEESEWDPVWETYICKDCFNAVFTWEIK